MLGDMLMLLQFVVGGLVLLFGVSFAFAVGFPLSIPLAIAALFVGVGIMQHDF